MNSAVEFSRLGNYHTNRNNPVKWIFSHGIQQWRIILIALIGAVGNAILGAVGPVLIGQTLNLLIAPPVDLTKLAQMAIIIGISQVVRPVLQLARNFGFEFIAQRVEKNIRDELYLNLLGKSMTFHNLQAVGDTMARATNDVREVNYLFSPGLNMVIGSIIFLIMPVIIAPRYHPSLVLVPIIFIILYFLALKGYLNTLRPITDEVRIAFGNLNERLNEVLEGIEVVKGAAQEKAEVDLFNKNADRYRKASVHQGDVEARFLPMLLFSLALGFGLLHALILFKQGVLDVGGVVGYFGVLLLLDFPTFTSLWAYSQISLGLAGARRILEIMQRETNLDQNLEGYSGEMRGEVEFKNVSFQYPGTDRVISDVSFKVEAGQTVAIVGQTGAGKTSLVKMINRIYDATEGTVMVDGVDVRQWNLEALRQNISIIEQDVFLFSRSLAENISFGKPGASEEEIHYAAQAAQVDEFIGSFKDGFATIIGERGVTLSGGQRQRIALARAFLTDPGILILDDSTSSIDSATEDKIQRAIFTAAKGRTTFIITHRLSQIRWADLIIVLHKGKIAAIGNHNELLETSEAYRNIFSE